MFTNILLISLLSLISLGRTNGEDRNAISSLLDVPIQQQQYEDLSFYKMPRTIRNLPFRNSEIMTARGFGKRDYENNEDFVDNYIPLASQPISQERWQKPLFFPILQDAFRMPSRVSYNSVSVPKRNDLKFRLNDGNLRIGRGFGKRSYFLDTQPSNSMESATGFLEENSQQQQPFKSKGTKEET